MSVYKSLTTSDVIVTPFKVNKNFIFQGANEITASNIGIDRFIGKNISYVSGSDLTGQIVSQSQALIYQSAKQLYYTNYLNGPNGSPVLTSSIQTDDGALAWAMYESFVMVTSADASHEFRYTVHL